MFVEDSAGSGLGAGRQSRCESGIGFGSSNRAVLRLTNENKVFRDQFREKWNVWF
jgi:hypothetical protein